MKHGFVKVAACTPALRVADPSYNASKIMEMIDEAEEQGAKIAVFPELCITGYTCQDLFFQELLLKQARTALQHIADYTDGMDILVFVGLPLAKDNKIYNVAAAIWDGKILAFIPKKNIPNYGEFQEARYFAQGNEEPQTMLFDEEEVWFGTNILLKCSNMEELVVGCEICEDLWAVNPPASAHALAGATVIVNLSASNETIGKKEYRKLLVESASARMIAGYIFTSSGEGESTQDLVFGGHRMIAENGIMLAEERSFQSGILFSEIDVARLSSERRKNNAYCGERTGFHWNVSFELDEDTTRLSRTISASPFIPSDTAKREENCEEILSIQAYGLKKRYEHIGCKTAVVGISGGLDSTLALLVTVRAFDLLGIDRKNIYTITMPCFGTTDRTYDNACKLARMLGTTLKEVNIKNAVKVHFEDIGQDMEKHDVTFENAQARERTQVLMDVANQVNGLVIGTGDLSELALGWATYNGDHMSMYGVNGGVPKTLVRHLVRYCGEKTEDEELKATLFDVLDTPVSPELLPPVEGDIAQKTEDLVGPYELHDFFLYYMLRFGFEPEKIYRLALLAFKDEYEEDVILKWLKNYYRRFFAQHFKRSCLPDGPKVGSVGVSPRGDLRMPTDASVSLWMKQVEEL